MTDPPDRSTVPAIARPMRARSPTGAISSATTRSTVALGGGRCIVRHGWWTPKIRVHANGAMAARPVKGSLSTWLGKEERDGGDDVRVRGRRVDIGAGA